MWTPYISSHIMSKIVIEDERKIYALEKKDNSLMDEDNEGCHSTGGWTDWEWLLIDTLPNVGEFEHVGELSFELKHTHLSKP